MDFKKNSNKLLRGAFIILSYLAIVAFVLIVLRDRAPSLKLFTDHYINISLLWFIFFASFASTAGYLFYSKRNIILSFIKTDIFRYTTLLIVAAVGLYFKFHALDLIILLYAVYAILFINRSLENIQLYKSTLNFIDRFVSGLFHSEGRTPALLALLLIISLPILLILKKTAIAENIAVYAYYFLIITVILQIIELKLGIERENHLLVLLRDSSRAIYAALVDRKIWTKFIVWVRSSCQHLFTRNKILYLTVLMIILALTYAAKSLYWKDMVRTVNGNPQYRSELSLPKPDVNELTFPSYTDEITVPIRIKHPANHPFLWQNTGAHAVNLGILWFQENQAGRMEKKVFEDYQPLPQSLFINESIEMQVKLRRPVVPTGRTYEVWIGLVSDGNWWFSRWGDSVKKLRIYAEKLSYEKDYILETRIYDSLQKKIEEAWSLQLYSSGNNYHSTIAVLKNNLFSKKKVSVVVKNNGKIPWPVHNLYPVKIGVVWLQRIEENGSSRYIHLLEEKHALPDVVFPGETQVVDLSVDPFKVRKADKIWIGMVHEGKTWFYKRGDPAIELIQNIDKYKILAQQKAIVRNENMQMSMELNKRRVSGPIEETTNFEGASYRSKIQLLNHKTDELLESNENGLDLELEMTNTGKVPWIVGTGQQPTEKNVIVNLGILWFKKSEKKLEYSKRIAEERCVFPVTVLENVTVRMECKIGKEVKPGNYEVWIGPVHEAVTWFYQRGDQVLKLDVTVP